MTSKPLSSPLEITPIGSVSTIQTSYAWEIEDVDEYWNCKPGEAIMSPTFITLTSNTTEKMWNMFLFFSGDCERNKQYLSIFVQPKCNNCEENQIRLSLLNKQNQKVYGILFYERLTFSKDKVRWGSSKYIHKHVFSEMSSQILPNLTILCEVVVSNIGMQSVLHYQEKKMHTDIGSLLNDGNFSDLILVVEGKKFTTHRNILAARSTTFAQWFKDGTIKKDQSRFEIDTCSCKIFTKILQFIYSEKADFQEDDALELLKAAAVYGLDELKLLCEDMLGENLNFSNVITNHIVADLVQANNLKERSMNFIISNAREVLDIQEYKNMVGEYPHLLREIYEQTVLRYNI